MKTVDTFYHSHAGEGEELVPQAASEALAGWGRADQVLPEL
ncbi:hypothetical protein [Sphingomonas floccifaciens]